MYPRLVLGAPRFRPHGADLHHHLAEQGRAQPEGVEETSQKYRLIMMIPASNLWPCQYFDHEMTCKNMGYWYCWSMWNDVFYGLIMMIPVAHTEGCDDRLCQASLLLNYKFIEEVRGKRSSVFLCRGDTNLGTCGPRALGFLGGSSGYPWKGMVDVGFRGYISHAVGQVIWNFP